MRDNPLCFKYYYNYVHQHKINKSTNGYGQTSALHGRYQ